MQSGSFYIHFFRDENFLPISAWDQCKSVEIAKCIYEESTLQNLGCELFIWLDRWFSWNQVLKVIKWPQNSREFTKELLKRVDLRDPWVASQTPAANMVNLVHRSGVEILSSFFIVARRLIASLIVQNIHCHYENVHRPSLAKLHFWKFWEVS